VSTVLGIVSAVVLVTTHAGASFVSTKRVKMSAAIVHGAARQILWDLAPQRTGEAAKHYFEHIVNGRVTELWVSRQSAGLSAGGGVRRLSARSEALHDARGQIECVICTAVDITEQRLAESRYAV